MKLGRELIGVIPTVAQTIWRRDDPCVTPLPKSYGQERCYYGILRVQKTIMSDYSEGGFKEIVDAMKALAYRFESMSIYGIDGLSDKGRELLSQFLHSCSLFQPDASIRRKEKELLGPWELLRHLESVVIELGESSRIERERRANRHSAHPPMIISEFPPLPSPGGQP